MKNERETRRNLLISAKEEFMDKGYTAASLRGICKRADVTTGALYFFFKDKADLFAALVDEPVNRLYQVMEKHYNEELNKDFDVRDPAEWKSDLDAALRIVRYMYKYHDEFVLVLTKSQGSGYEKCMERFIDVTERHYRRLTDLICENWGIPSLDDYTIHWMSHMHIDTFVHLISHEESEEAACRHMKQMVGYFVSGFFGMLKAQNVRRGE